MVLLIFFVPRHLDGFELALVGLLGIVLELGQFCYIAMQIGETHRKRIAKPQTAMIPREGVPGMSRPRCVATLLVASLPGAYLIIRGNVGAVPQ